MDVEGGNLLLAFARGGLVVLHAAVVLATLALDGVLAAAEGAFAHGIPRAGRVLPLQRVVASPLGLVFCPRCRVGRAPLWQSTLLVSGRALRGDLRAKFLNLAGGLLGFDKFLETEASIGCQQEVRLGEARVDGGWLLGSIRAHRVRKDLVDHLLLRLVVLSVEFFEGFAHGNLSTANFHVLKEGVVDGGARALVKGVKFAKEAARLPRGASSL